MSLEVISKSAICDETDHNDVILKSSVTSLSYPYSLGPRNTKCCVQFSSVLGFGVLRVQRDRLVSFSPNKALQGRECAFKAQLDTAECVLNAPSLQEHG